MSEPGQLREQAEDRVLVHYDTRLPHLSRWQRMQIPVIAGGAWLPSERWGRRCDLKSSAGKRWAAITARISLRMFRSYLALLTSSLQP
jgi:hypothetical protein